MYRLTVAGPVVEQIRIAWNKCPRKWLRIYRWGNKWGEYCQEFDRLTCATRERIATFEDDVQMILERIHLIDCDIPYSVDDIWEEEVLYRDKGVCGQHLFVVEGTYSDLMNMCKEWISDHVDWLQANLGTIQEVIKPVVQRSSNIPRRPICLIQED